MGNSIFATKPATTTISAKSSILEANDEMLTSIKSGKPDWSLVEAEGISKDETFSFAYMGNDLALKLDGDSLIIPAPTEGVWINDFIADCVKQRDIALKTFSTEEIAEKWYGDEGFKSRPSVGMSAPIKLGAKHYRLSVYANTTPDNGEWGISLGVKLSPSSAPKSTGVKNRI